MDLKRLDEVADLRTGYPFRNRVEAVPNGSCLLVQMKDLDVAGGLRERDFVRVDAPPNYLSHVLHHGDVLMVGRGARNPAVTFVSEPGDTIAAANLFVLRLRGSTLPDYLTWFLNLPATQARLRAKRAGSSVLFLALTELAGLEIPLPSIEQQHHIVELRKLCQEEQRLMEEVLEKRRELMAGVSECLLTNQLTA